MIDVTVKFAEQGDEIPKSGEFSVSGIDFSEVFLFIAFGY
jgi:hypothetical protein